MLVTHLDLKLVHCAGWAFFSLWGQGPNFILFHITSWVLSLFINTIIIRWRIRIGKRQKLWTKHIQQVEKLESGLIYTKTCTFIYSFYITILVINLSSWFFYFILFYIFSLLFCGCARPQLEAARHLGARPVACFSSLWRKENRLPAVQQPEEPRQVPRTGAGLLSEELRGRWAHTTRVWFSIPVPPAGRAEEDLASPLWGPCLKRRTAFTLQYMCDVFVFAAYSKRIITVALNWQIRPCLSNVMRLWAWSRFLI